MKSKRRNPVALLGTLFALMTAADPLAAQTTAPTPGKDEVIELSPFVVNASEDNGYQAANTLAGSRMSTSLRDTPASLNVLTAEMIRDIGALDLTQAVAFANNVELETPDGNGRFEFFNTFQIRGQAATVARNYFRWKLPTNNYNVERIEEARGPNSILFGIASAGGLVSASTKHANTNRNFRKVSLIYGSYEERRAAIDINQSSSDKKLGVRLNAVTYQTQAYQHYAGSKDNRAHLALKYNLGENTVIRGEYETGHTTNAPADNQEVGDNVMRWIAAGRPVRVVTATDNAAGITRFASTGNLALIRVEDASGGVVYNDLRQLGVSQQLTPALITDPTLIDNVNYQVNLGGPTQSQETDFDTYSFFIDQKLWKNTFVQLSYNHQNYDFNAWQANNPTGLKGDPNQFLKDGVTPNPHAGQLYFETNWVNRQRREELDNFRLMVSHELDLGKWGEYRLAGLAEREESNWAKQNFADVWWDPATNLGAYNSTQPNNSANVVLRRHYITERDYSTYYASYANPGVTGLLSGVTDPTNPARKLDTRFVQQSGSDFDDPQEQDSFLLSGQGFFFKRKLVLAGGYRADTLYLHEGARNLQDPLTREFIIDNVNNPRTNRTIDGKTRTYGAVYHVLPWLSLRYNNSNSTELANVGVRLMPRPDANGLFIGSRVGDAPKGEGEDYGVELNLFEGKINLRATRFETTRVGAQGFTYGGTNDSPTTISNRIMDVLLNNGLVSATERANHQLNVSGSEFDVASTGYEFTLVANPNRNWRLVANYSDTNAVTSNVAPEIQVWAAAEIPYFQRFDQSLVIPATGTTIAQEIARWQGFNDTNRSVEGFNTIGQRPKKLSGLVSYSFPSGPLKGLSLGASARHQSKQVIGFSTLRKELVFGNSFTRADSFIRYRFGRVPRLKFIKDLTLQLNVYNVLDQHDPLVTRVSDTNATVLAVNRLVPQSPRSWRLTADFAF